MKKNKLSVPRSTDNFLQSRRFRLSFLYSVPIGVLGGLIGLGGAEFRLPVLAGILGYSVRQAYAGGNFKYFRVSGFLQSQIAKSIT